MTTTRRPRRWWPLVPALVVATLGAACGDEADDASGSGGSGGEVVTGDVDFEATGRFLAAASQRTMDVPYEFEMSMAMQASGGGDEIDIEAPLIAGAQDGERYGYRMDMGPWIEETASQTGRDIGLPMDELTMDMVGDRETLYLRAPMYAALAESGASLGPAAELAVLDDQWGRVDLTALGDLSLTNVQSTAGSPGGADPRALLDVVSGAEGVEELGTDEVDGTGVNGLGADVSLGEMLEAQGLSADRFVDQMSANLGMPSGASEAEAGEVMDTIVRTDIPFEVWVDGSGYVRRVAYEFNLLEMFSGLPGISDQIEGFTMGTTMDFSGYGEDVEIETPPADAVDVTDVYRRLLEAGQAGGVGGTGGAGG
jgi:hypothetical protein